MSDRTVQMDLGPGVIAAVTRRHGGVSRPPFDTFNMSTKVDYSSLSDIEQSEHLADALENRRSLSEELGIDADAWVVARLVHGSTVRVISESDRGSGADRFEDGIPNCDSLVTNVPDIPLAVLVADCAPVFIYDPENHACGVAHAGYGGAIEGVAKRTVEIMSIYYGTSPANVRVVVGPCLGPQSLEMQNLSIIDRAERAFPGEASLTGPNGTPHLNVPAMVRRQLLDAGVSESNIDETGLDTAGGEEFFSYRATPKNFFDPSDQTRYTQATGRLAAIIAVRST